MAEQTTPPAPSGAPRPNPSERSGPVVVLHVFGQMERGGAELRTVELMKHLDPSVVRLVFLTLESEPGELDEEIRALGSEVYPAPMGPLWPLRLRRIARRENVTVLHSHTATATGAFLLAAWLVGIPRRIAHFRSDGDGKGESVRRRVQRRVMRWLIARCATDVLAVSPAALEFAGNLDRSRARRAVMASGLDTEPIRRALEERTGPVLPDRPPGRLLVHVGRPNPDKRRALAVDIMRTLNERGTAVSLALVGPTEPEEVDDLQERAGAHRDRLLVLGGRDDVPALFAEADAVLLTSYLEGLPGVVLEASAVGTPCVASDLPGVRWIVEELPTGIHPVDADAPVEAWADAVVESFGDPHVEPEKSLRRMEESVFAMSQAAAAFQQLWSGR